MNNEIEIDLKYYNKRHYDLLKHYPSFKAINDLIVNGCKISKSEFLTYYLFYKKRPNLSGYDTYESISRKIMLATLDLEGFVSFDNHSINATKEATPFNNSISEKIGEAIGLSVINKIHGLTAADWGKIPEQNKYKTLDYELASDKHNIIQVETKGSCNDNNEYKCPSVSQHKKSIEDKKEQNRINVKVAKNGLKNPIMYGTIASFDRRSSIARCWILDPDPIQYNRNPLEIKLINRLRYITAWVNYVSPRSSLSLALINRTHIIALSRNPFEFDNTPILNLHHEPFTKYNLGGDIDKESFFTGKSYVINTDYTGVVRSFKNNNLIFVGIAEDLAALAAQQKYENILNFHLEAQATNVEILCSIPEWDYDSLHQNIKNTTTTKAIGNKIQFRLPFYLHRDQSGLAIGFHSVNL